MMNKKEREENLAYLEWFRCNADFGPASEDVIAELNEQFELDTGKKVPKHWRRDHE